MSERGFRRHQANPTTGPGPTGSASRRGVPGAAPGEGARRDGQGARAGDAPASFPGHCPTCPEGQDAACSLHSGARSGRGSGTAPIARWSRGERASERERASGAGSRRPHLVVPLQAPEGRPAHPGPARGAPFSAPQSRVRAAPPVRRGRRGHFVRRRRSRPRSTKVAAPGSCPAPAAPRELRAEAVGSPAYPHAGPGLVASPPPPRPARIRLRSDTRSPRPTPGHVSRAPGGPRSLGQTKGPRDAAGPGPGAPGDRAKGGGGGHKAAFVAPRPARGGGGGLNRPQRRPDPTERAAPGSEGRGSRCPPPPTAPSTAVPAASQPPPPPAGRPQPGSLPPGTHGNGGPGRRGADAGL